MAENPPDDDLSGITLTSKYDPRNSGILPSVKNQGSYGTCWTFASLGALEASYNAQGLGTTAPDLSELHLAWFVYKDPRTGYSEKLYDSKETALNQGGNSSYSISFLSRMGTASETDLPYTSASRVETLTKNKYPENYNHPLRLKDAYRLGPVTSDNRDTVKRLIMKFGALYITYEHENSRLSGSSYYNPTDYGYGHAVDVVGWDDNYSRNNFKTKPNIDGAWLVKNSWGTSWGDQGYFWMSYAQKIGDCAVFVAGEGSSSRLYGHDAVAAIETIPYHWSANVFRSEKAESLTEVSFHTRQNNVNYEVYVNRFGKTEPSNPGQPNTLAARGKLPYSGYHTVTLSSPVELKAGEYFSVMVKLTVEGSSSRYITAAVDSAKNNNITAASITVAGKSYFSQPQTTPTSSDWKDGTRLTQTTSMKYCNASIRVSTTSGTSSAFKITTSSLPSAVKGQNYSYTLKASGSSSVSWSVEGLPSGMRLNGSTITGAPSVSGRYTLTVTARSSSDSDTAKLLLTVNEPSSPDDGTTGSSEGGGGGGCNLGVTLAGMAAAVVMIKRKM